MTDQPPAPTLVMKFGGTSVGTAEAIRQVVDITREARKDYPRVAIVVSALSGVTDLLLSNAMYAVKGDTGTFQQVAMELRARHHSVAAALVQDRTRLDRLGQEMEGLIYSVINLCQAVAVLGEATPRALDAIVSTGERLSIRLIAAALEDAGIAATPVEATQCVITDNNYQAAHPVYPQTTEATRAALLPLLEKGIVPVVTGFVGATADGSITTLGRGGSDYSAAIIGSALPASDVWIWTDVDGVMTADPRIVPAARTIPELTYRETAELAYFGAKVLHPKTIRPVIEAGIGLRICNTFNPKNPGTRLTNGVEKTATGVIKSVTAIKGLRMITVEGKGMLGVPGVAARTFAAVAATGTSVPLISQASSEQSICFAVPKEASDAVVDAVRAAFTQEISNRDIDSVWAGEEVVIITVVGEGMRSTPGIAGKVFTVLGEQNVNVIAIAQGSSEVSISLVTSAENSKTAVQALHSLIQ